MKKVDLVTILAVMTIIQGMLTYFIDTRIDKKFYQLEHKVSVLGAQYSFWLTTMTNENWADKNADDLKDIKNLLEKVVNGKSNTRVN